MSEAMIQSNNSIDFYDAFIALLAIIFIFLLVLNFLKIKKKPLIIWTILSIVIPATTLSLVNYLECNQDQKVFLCGLDNIIIWGYAAPIIIVLTQLILLLSKKYRVKKE